MLATLTDPLAYAFFQKGLLVATLSGALLGLIGVYVVLRGMSYLGHGLSHSIFGGFAASQLFVAHFYVLGAGLWGVVSALAITQVARRSRLGADAAIGVISTASFALGVALFAIPAVIARMLTDAFGRMLWLSTVIGGVCGIVGMYLSHFAGVPSGTMIVLVGAALFVIVLAITRGRGMSRSAGLDRHPETATVPTA